MKRIFEIAKKRFRSAVRSGKSTQHKLNYLTLRIDSKEITTDLYQHSLNQKIYLFWILNILVLINLFAALLSFFKSGKKDFGWLSFALIYWIYLGPLFKLFSCRFRRGIRYVPVFLFLTLSSYVCLGNLWLGGKILLSGIEDLTD
jgi:hypothetical protein